MGWLWVDMFSGLVWYLVILYLFDFLVWYLGIEIELSGIDCCVDLICEGFDCVVWVGLFDDNILVVWLLGWMYIVNCVSLVYFVVRGVLYVLVDLFVYVLVYYVGMLGQCLFGFEYYDGQCYWILLMYGVVMVNSGESYIVVVLVGFGIIQVFCLGV